MLQLSTKRSSNSLCDDIKVSFDKRVPLGLSHLDYNANYDKTLALRLQSPIAKSSIKPELQTPQDVGQASFTCQEALSQNRKAAQKVQRQWFSFVKSQKNLTDNHEKKEEDEDPQVSPFDILPINPFQETANQSYENFEKQQLTSTVKIQQFQNCLFRQTQYVVHNPSIDQIPSQYQRFQNYSFRKLGAQHRIQALKLLTKNFIENEPLAKSYYEQFPDQKAEAYAYWSEYWDMYMDDAIESGVSLAVVDVTNNDELIGVYTFKNFNYVPDNPDLDEKYLKGFTILSSEVVLEQQLIQQASPEVQDILLSSQLVAEAWAAAIKDGHTGKKLYSKMTALAERVLREAGFEYALVFASNFLSSKVLKKLDFTQIAQIDCQQFEHSGEKPFALIEELHKSPSLWFKKFK